MLLEQTIEGHFQFTPEGKEEVKELLEQISGTAKGRLDVAWGEIYMPLEEFVTTVYLNKNTVRGDVLQILEVKEDGDWRNICRLELPSLEPNDYIQIAAWGSTETSIDSILMMKDRDHSWQLLFNNPVELSFDEE